MSLELRYHGRTLEDMLNVFHVEILGDNDVIERSYLNLFYFNLCLF